MPHENYIPLESITIANPCRADWNLMQGDDTARFCQSCEKHVYNLSEMTRREAEALIQEKEGSLCVRYFQRPDGTMLTADCPIGLSPARRPWWQYLGAGAAAIIALLTGPLGVAAPSRKAAPSQGQPTAARSKAPARTKTKLAKPVPRPGVRQGSTPKAPRQLMGKPAPAVVPAPQHRAVLGEMAAVLLPTATPSKPAKETTVQEPLMGSIAPPVNR